MEIHSIESFLGYWGKIRGRTRRVLEVIPADRIDWSDADGRWTLGDLVRHLALLERWMFAETVHGRPSLYGGCGPELAATRDEVLDLFERLGEETVSILGELDDEALQGRCRTPGGAELPVWKWLRAMVEHHVHHRGQIYLYLALLDVATPPLYGLTAEEVEERSGSC